MGPSNNSYLLNTAVFHFNDYGRSRVPPERQRSPHPTHNTRFPMRLSLISSRLLGLGKLGSIFRRDEGGGGGSVILIGMEN